MKDTTSPAMLSLSTDDRRRLQTTITAWGVVVADVAETETSVIACGRRGDQPVVVKLIKRPGDEWNSGRVLRAFGGLGAVRVLDDIDGALLLERLQPAISLASVTTSETDESSTAILSGVIDRMADCEPPAGRPTIEDWALSFERYNPQVDARIPVSLLNDARAIYGDLCRSQGKRRLLHGDLHHDNVLLDKTRGWLAIDPKGVVGELAYEVGAAMRNPIDKPEIFLQPSTSAMRTTVFVERLNLDRERVLAWTFAQAVLAAVWACEDGIEGDLVNHWIALAHAVRPTL